MFADDTKLAAQKRVSTPSVGKDNGMIKGVNTRGKI